VNDRQGQRDHAGRLMQKRERQRGDRKQRPNPKRHLHGRAGAIALVILLVAQIYHHSRVQLPVLRNVLILLKLR
jgi:hypothetical protein